MSDQEVDDWGMPLDPEQPCPVCGARLCDHGVANFMRCQDTMHARKMNMRDGMVLADECPHGVPLDDGSCEACEGLVKAVSECKVCSAAVIPQSCEGCVERLRDDNTRLRRERNQWRQQFGEVSRRDDKQRTAIARAGGRLCSMRDRCFAEGDKAMSESIQEVIAILSEVV